MALAQPFLSLAITIRPQREVVALTSKKIHKWRDESIVLKRLTRLSSLSTQKALNGPRFEIKRHEVNKNKIKTRTFDVTNYLHNELDIAAFLRAAIKDGDQVLLASALGDAASAFGKTQLTNDNGLTKKSF